MIVAKRMIAALRNLAIALGVSLTALLMGAGLQEIFVRLIPASRVLSLGPIDFGSWVGFAAIFLSFSFACILQVRWLRSSAILPWILLGPLLFAVVAYSQGLDVSGCLRHWAVLPRTSRISCSMVTTTLLLPLLGALAGYMALLLWRRSAARGEIAVQQ